MNDELTFRQDTRATDAQSIRELTASTGFFTNAEIDVAVELVEERLQKGESSGYYFLFAEREGRVVGYTCFGPIPCTLSSYDLYWIAVHHDLRGKGIGKILMQKSEDAIGKMGGQRIYIETSSRQQYDSTRRFYLACAYEEAAFFADFYAPGDGKVVYLKTLSMG
ncbi:hypothetical protein U14_02976 [Candidatus Moduliflexus flocculans]|uniref:N-acetyltransferase domain-containing protein n=1 Tax=Candidatus Moduliflexus flocculans TaxID=1499966 RepID=A0A081BMW5_9BACT|nr:hypothetical protein U14_02976 [Candidatus Moduliflexus flocculans]